MFVFLLRLLSGSNICGLAVATFDDWSPPMERTVEESKNVYKANADTSNALMSESTRLNRCHSYPHVPLW